MWINVTEVVFESRSQCFEFMYTKGEDCFYLELRT